MRGCQGWLQRATQGEDQHAPQQQQQLHSSISRRQSLAGMGALLGLVPGAATASPSSDLVEGTQNWLHLGVQSYNLWWQGLVDGIANDDQTGLTAEQQGQRKARRFGSISVPGLSSFSFIHGTLVGATLIALISLAGSGSARQQEQQQQQLPALRPEVEAALARLLASPETSSTFHDPAVHAALQDVRADLRNINKYRDDPAVMTAFQKLLEIEDILERL
uniref:STI1/HOP DP domain-containing protein n=1 Tax=Tetradesmus obliquus TaxID=3088 RepID=A0A383WLE2_TETOB